MEMKNYRLPLTPKESPREKRARLKRERQQANAFIRFRMDVIAETYSVPLKYLFLTAAYKEFLKRYGKELEKMKHLQSQTKLHGDHYFKVNNHGSVEDVRGAGKKKIPDNFYRTTKLASWRIFRHHHDKYGYQPAPAGYRRVSFTRPISQREDTNPYQEYLHMIDMMVRTKAEETQMEGRTRAGSFLLLTPFEKDQFRAHIEKRLLKPLPDTWHSIRRMDVPPVKRVADKLTEQKLQEQELKGKKVLFKGKGLPGDQSPTSSRKSSRKSTRGRTDSQGSRSSKQSVGATSGVVTGSEATTGDSEYETAASSAAPTTEGESAASETATKSEAPTEGESP
ncbi:hypothetical protein ACOMHN_035688 [Nucella lapillus]